VFDTGSNCPNPPTATVFEDATCSTPQRLENFAYLADLRSPTDCYHSEAYLIGWLVKLYGWRVLEPGTLRRGWRAQEIAAERVGHGHTYGTNKRSKLLSQAASLSDREEA
jgi:hypothetical protein